MCTEMYIGHHIISYCCPVLIKILIIFHSITFHKNSFGDYWLVTYRQADDHKDTAELIGTILLLLGAGAPKSERGSELSASAATQDVYESDAELLCWRFWGWHCLEPIWIFHVLLRVIPPGQRGHRAPWTPWRWTGARDVTCGNIIYNWELPGYGT